MAQAAKTAGVWSALSNELAGVVERVGPSVAAIHGRERIPSSGVLWREGVVVTANHTVRREEDITVVLHDGTALPAAIAGRDPTTDLATLRLGAPPQDTRSKRASARGASAPTSAAVVAAVGDASTLRAGELVLGIGRPGRDATVSVGIVRSVGGEWRTWRGGKIDHLIRLDMEVRDGFSGGALVDAAGSVVGLTTSGLSRGGAIAVPSVTVTRVVDQLLETGRIPRGYLGVGIQPVRIAESVATKMGISDRTGAMIMLVEPGSPAEQGGALMGDVLVDIDGTPAGRVGNLAALLGPEHVGKRITARVIRAGAIRELTLTVGERLQRSA